MSVVDLSLGLRCLSLSILAAWLSPDYMILARAARRRFCIVFGVTSSYLEPGVSASSSPNSAFDSILVAARADGVRSPVTHPERIQHRWIIGSSGLPSSVARCIAIIAPSGDPARVQAPARTARLRLTAGGTAPPNTMILKRSPHRAAQKRGAAQPDQQQKSVHRPRALRGGISPMPARAAYPLYHRHQCLTDESRLGI